MYSNSKDNGFCNSPTPISGIFEGISDFLKETTADLDGYCNYIYVTMSAYLLPHFPSPFCMLVHLERWSRVICSACWTYEQTVQPRV